MSESHKALVDEFLAASATESPKLARAHGKLSESGRAALGAVLRRFDHSNTGALDESERALARRVLGLMHTPSPKGLELLLGVLDRLDANENQTTEHSELMMAVEILEMFCKADSVNDTLSARELEMLHAVLDSLDAADGGVLSEAARRSLRDGLWDPDAFLEEQKQSNPAFRALAGG